MDEEREVSKSSDRPTDQEPPISGWTDSGGGKDLMREKQSTGPSYPLPSPGLFFENAWTKYLDLLEN